MPKRHLTTLLAFGLLIVFLAGCNKPEEKPSRSVETPIPSESPIPSPSPSPTPTPTPTPTPEPTPTPWPVWDVVPENLQELHNENEDFIGWLYVEGTKIDYPVLQSSTEDPEYYLNRDFYGNSDVNGIPFMDARCSADPLDTVSVLYGHNMRSGVMFKTLLSYESEDFRDEYPYINFDTMIGPGLYEVVAAFWFDASGDKNGFQPHNYIRLKSEERFYTYIDEVNKITIYDKKVEAEFGDQFVMLMTCDRRVIPDGRMFVLAKRIHT